MALFDWNMDGKKDMFDSFLEYQIYNECMKDDSDHDDDSDYEYDYLFDDLDD